MGGQEEEPWEERWERKIRRFGRKLKRRLPKGTTHQLKNLLSGMLVFLLMVMIAILAYDAWWYRILDTTTILSIVVADIPVGFVLWAVTQRRESVSRRLLDAVELTEAPAKFKHLEIHRSDWWDDADYPEEEYYIVNWNTKKAYWVRQHIEDLVQEGIIRRAEMYADAEALHRFFQANAIELVHDYPQGDDLFRES